MDLPGRINDMYFSCSGHLKYLPEHMVLLLTPEFRFSVFQAILPKPEIRFSVFRADLPKPEFRF
jgi:hypothetical protein